jgi:hypothetical protein
MTLYHHQKKHEQENQINVPIPLQKTSDRMSPDFQEDPHPHVFMTLPKKDIVMGEILKDIATEEISKNTEKDPENIMIDKIPKDIIMDEIPKDIIMDEIPKDAEKNQKDMTIHCMEDTIDNCDIINIINLHIQNLINFKKSIKDDNDMIYKKKIIYDTINYFMQKCKLENSNDDKLENSNDGKFENSNDGKFENSNDSKFENSNDSNNDHIYRNYINSYEPNDSSDESESSDSNSSCYSNTQSDYNFDDTDKHLKIKLDNLIKKVAHELKERKNLKYVRISKKRKYVAYL